MSLSIVHSRALLGLQAHPVCVEVHLANGLPSFTLVGLAETEVKEARERVRSAIQNTGLEFPGNKRITVNLAPADLPKDSGRFDLPIALGILAASGQIDGQKMQGYEFAGELSLGGDLRPVRGALAMSLAISQGMATQSSKYTPKLVLPETSAQEAGLVPGAEIFAAQHLLDVVRQFLPGDAAVDVLDGWRRVQPTGHKPQTRYADMADVKGQAAARRALEIAAAGGHSILMMCTNYFRTFYCRALPKCIHRTSGAARKLFRSTQLPTPQLVLWLEESAIQPYALNARASLRCWN